MAGAWMPVFVCTPVSIGVSNETTVENKRPYIPNVCLVPGWLGIKLNKGGEYVCEINIMNRPYLYVLRATDTRFLPSSFILRSKPFDLFAFPSPSCGVTVRSLISFFCYYAPQREILHCMEL